MQDTFTGTTLDAAKWTAFTSGSGTVTQNGQVTLATTTSAGVARLTTVTKQSLVADAMRVRYVSKSGPVALDVLAYLDASNDGYLFRISFNGGNLQFCTVAAGVATVESQPVFDAVNHAVMQLRVDATTVYWDAGPNAGAIANVFSKARSAAVDHTSGDARINVDNTGEGAVGSLTVDDFVWGAAAASVLRPRGRRWGLGW